MVENYALERDEIEKGVCADCQSHPTSDSVTVDHDSLALAWRTSAPFVSAPDFDIWRASRPPDATQTLGQTRPGRVAGHLQDTHPPRRCADLVAEATVRELCSPADETTRHELSGTTTAD